MTVEGGDTSGGVCRLLVIADSFPIRPGEGTWRSLFVAVFCVALAARGHVVSVLAPGRPGMQGAFPGVQVERFGWLGDERVRRLPHAARFGVGSLIQTGDYFRRGLEVARVEAMRLYPQMTLAVGVYPAGAFTRGLYDLFGIPYSVWTLDGDLEHYERLWQRPVVHQIYLQASYCGADSNTLAATIARIRDRGCEQWPAALTPPPTLPAPRPRPRRFLAVGALRPEQGFDLLIEAFGLAAPQMPRAELTLHGDGPEREALMARAEELRIASRVRFVPAAGLDACRAEIAAADALVMPARRAGVPMVLVDAVNARRPLLVSDAGDLPEVVREHGVGEIVARDDVDGLADALWRAYHRGFDVPAGAFERAAAELSLSSSVDRWDAILGEVLKRRGR